VNQVIEVNMTSVPSFRRSRPCGLVPRKPLFNRNFGAIADGFSAATVVPPAHERNGLVGIPL
jgi:hypothetical protein